MDLNDVADGIAAAVADVPGLQVFGYLADRVDPPALVVAYPQVQYDIDFGDDDVWLLPVYVFLTKVTDETVRGQLSDYTSRAGPYSIKSLIEADKTLGGSCDTVAVKRARPGTAIVAGTELLSIEFTLEVFG